MERILIVEDERLLRKSIREALESEGYGVTDVDRVDRALDSLGREEFDLAVVDQRLPDGEGMDVLRAVKARFPDVPVVLMTAYSSVQDAVEAMRRGAYDYLNKPFDLDELILVIGKALETTRLRREVSFYATSQKQAHGLDRILGASEAITTLKGQVRRVLAASSSTLLIRGESGTGKGMLAKAIHYESDRARAPFVNVTCTAIPETLLESELFGHERGAFTGAHARKKGQFELGRGGSVFLDEIGDLPGGLQAKLLRFLEDRTFRRVGGTQDISVDVRIIAATNRDLEKAVAEGQFREDLYYRLNVIPLVMPPLRECARDAALLAKAFLVEFAKEFGRPTTGMTPSALDVLCAYAWPGNVRQLRNVIERMLILSTADPIDVVDLPPELGSAVSGGGASGGDGGGAPRNGADLFVLPAGGVKWENVEQALVEQAIERTNGNQSKAAKLLGLSRDQLRYRLQRFGLLDG